MTWVNHDRDALTFYVTIKAWFCGKEYVLAQPMDESMTEWEVSEILRAEYKLLSQCHGFKALFDKFEKECGVERIPCKLPSQLGMFLTIYSFWYI